MSSRRIQFTPTARAELRRIIRHSRRTWGEAQGTAYQSTFDRAFARVAAFPGAGTPIPDYETDVRRLTVAQHYVFYETLPDRVRVVRITHVRMDDPELDAG